MGAVEQPAHRPAEGVGVQQRRARARRQAEPLALHRDTHQRPGADRVDRRPSIGAGDASASLLGNLGLGSSNLFSGLARDPLGELYAMTAGDDGGVSGSIDRLYRIVLDVVFANGVGNLGADLVLGGGLAISPSGAAYGVTRSTVANPSQRELFSIDLVTGAATVIGAFPPNTLISGLTWRSDGMLAGVDSTANELVSIDPSTAALSTVASLTPTVGSGLGGLASVGDTGFLATGGLGGSGADELWRVDLITGTQNRIGALSPAFSGNGITGLAALVQLHEFPGQAPCDTTLQACIDAAAPGDIVEIVTNGPIDESPSITGSLTLRAGQSFSPVFSAPNTVTATSTGAEHETLTIEGLTLETGRILVAIGTQYSYTANIRDNVIQQSFGNSAGIEFRAGTSVALGKMGFDISGNVIDMAVPFSSGIDGIAVGLGAAAGGAGVIRDNRITMNGPNDGNAIGLASGDHLLTVDVVSNEIRGSGYNSGISIFQFGASGVTTARVLNNLVNGQQSFAGAPAAISLNVTQGTADAFVASNTVSGNDRGILVNGRFDLGAVITGRLANNIVAFQSISGIDIDTDFEPAVSNDFNLVFGNGSDFFAAGPNTFTSDPLFVGSGDFRVLFGSPAVDAGGTGDVPFDLSSDLDGSPRVLGATVDLGAYEAPPLAPALPVAAAGILVGLLGLIAARRATP